MDILVIDRESLTNQLLMSRLGAKGHRVVVEPNKNLAFDLIREKGFDCILVDPAPLSEARPVIIGLWKNIRSTPKPYIMLLSKTATTEEAILSGTNDVLHKPLSSQDIETKTVSAMRFMDIGRWLAHEDNIHSADGMIGKAAFYQLYLSANDRAFRYGERSFVVFITMTNHAELAAEIGEEEYDKTLHLLAAKMTYMRRQSDVIGRLGSHDFAILLQRPQYETEPVDAINRFSEVLDEFHHSFDSKGLGPCMRLSLIELPQGAQHAERFVPLTLDAAAEG
jgi:PleD family two-component response regulator